MNRFVGRRPERWTCLPVRHRRRNRLQLGRLLLGMTLFTSTLATPVGVAAASTVVEAENVGKTLPASASSRTTTRVTTQTSSSADGFPCEGDRGGLLYQVVWQQNKSGNTFEILRYDVDKAKYDVAASYRSKNVPGDADGDGNPNGLSLDSEGRAYVTYARDKNNEHVDLIQLLPDGTSQIIADISSSGSKDLNAGTYVEENGKPYVVVSNGFANSRGKKVDLTSGAVTDWAPRKGSPFGAKEKNVKDYVWVAEGINYRGKTYNIVGLEMNGTTGNVLLASSDPNVMMVTDTVSAPSDYSGTYGAAFNFKPGGVDSNEPTVVFFSNNGDKPAKKAFLTQLTWDDSDGDADGSFTLGTLGGHGENNQERWWGMPVRKSAEPGIGEGVAAGLCARQPHGNRFDIPAGDHQRRRFSSHLRSRCQGQRQPGCH